MCRSVSPCHLSSNKKYELTPGGRALFNNHGFLSIIEDLDLKDDVVIPTVSDLSDVPYVDDCLRILISIQRPRFDYIISIGREQNISKYNMSRALDVLLRGNLIEINERIYNLTEMGGKYVSEKNIKPNHIFYIKGLIKLFKTHMTVAPYIIKSLLKYNSLSVQEILISYPNLSERTAYRTVNNLIDFGLIMKKKKYFLSEKGLSLYKNEIFRKFLLDLY